jgi:hypothetical protein
MAATWTARTVVELYNLVVWNERNIELADDLLADTVIRHDVGGARTPASRCSASSAAKLPKFGTVVISKGFGIE